jgi:hypothetical protein
MQDLTEAGKQKISDLAHRYGVSTDAVMAMLQALVHGNGMMAQFNHPDLGGSGQWMRGGMIMVGDMFNNALKAKIDGLCNELSQLLAQQPAVLQPSASQSQHQSRGGQQQQQGGQGRFGQAIISPDASLFISPGGQQQQQQGGHGIFGQAGTSPEVSLFIPGGQGASGNWWPGDLGSPSSTGSQNDIRYAYFPASRRLAVEVHGHVTVYDTLDHQIGGVSQQQSTDASLTFTSQHGTVSVASLPVVSTPGVTPKATSGVTPKAPSAPAAEAQPASPPRAEAAQEKDIFAKIEQLAELERKGILTKEEYAAKKTELLGRL